MTQNPYRQHPIFRPPPPLSDEQPVELSVGFILAPDFTLFAFAGFVDVLRHAADEANYSRQIYCKWSVLGTTQAPVRSSCGIEVKPWETLDGQSSFDYLVVVGGTLPAAFDIDPAVQAHLQSADRSGTRIVGLCTGSFVLAQAGLLEGKSCAVAIGHEEEFNTLFPDIPTVSDQTYMIDRNVITCPGGSTAVDLAAQLVTQHCGPARSQKALRSMIIDQQRAEYQTPARPHDELTSCGDWRVEKAVLLMENNLAQPLTVSELARAIGTTPSQLSNAFSKRVRISPSAYWKKLRLEHAQWLLSNTTKRLSTIAQECGFYDSAHFTRAYKRFFNISPSDARSNNKRLLSLTNYQE